MPYARGIARAEARINKLSAAHRDIARQPRIQGTGQLHDRKITFSSETHDLAERMHARVRPPGRRQHG